MGCRDDIHTLDFSDEIQNETAYGRQSQGLSHAPTAYRGIARLNQTNSSSVS